MRYSSTSGSGLTFVLFLNTDSLAVLVVESIDLMLQETPGSGQRVDVNVVEDNPPTLRWPLYGAIPSAASGPYFPWRGALPLGNRFGIELAAPGHDWAITVCGFLTPTPVGGILGPP